MDSIHLDPSSAIGNTPLVYLRTIGKDLPAKIGRSFSINFICDKEVPSDWMNEKESINEWESESADELDFSFSC